MGRYWMKSRIVECRSACSLDHRAIKTCDRESEAHATAQLIPKIERAEYAATFAQVRRRGLHGDILRIEYGGDGPVREIEQLCSLFGRIFIFNITSGNALGREFFR